MDRSLVEIARAVSGFTHVSTKPEYYFDIYEPYFSPLRAKAGLKLVEVGVCEGESVKVFASYFRDAEILGIDLDDKKLDFSAYPRVRFEQADQADGPTLDRLARDFAPDGLDIVIDDASHVGMLSRLTFEALFPLVRPGGLYVVEDWGTGYIADWHDGAAVVPFAPAFGERPARIPSHDHGMVGFVKSLVDGVWSECMRDRLDGPAGPASPFDAIHVHKGLVVLRKA